MITEEQIKKAQEYNKRSKRLAAQTTLVMTLPMMLINSVMIYTTDDLDIMTTHVLIFTIMTLITGLSFATLSDK